LPATDPRGDVDRRTGVQIEGGLVNCILERDSGRRVDEGVATSDGMESGRSKAKKTIKETYERGEPISSKMHFQPKYCPEQGPDLQRTVHIV